MKIASTNKISHDNKLNYDEKSNYDHLKQNTKEDRQWWLMNRVRFLDG